MTRITALVILWVTIVESVLVFLSNLFTIFVFWKHRNRLKRTTFLLINLAVADLLVGFSQPIVIKTFAFPLQLETNTAIARSGITAAAFQGMFSFASLFSLSAISLERAFALVWPLRHRVTSTKVYIYSIVLVWISGISFGASLLLAAYGILDMKRWNISLYIVALLALLIICFSYLAIRKRLNCRVPPIDTHLYRQSGLQKNTRLSCTLFIVAAASLVFWLPSTIIYILFFLRSFRVPISLGYSGALFYLANSGVNPIIYSFRIPIFKETFTRKKLRKRSKQYRVSYRT